LAVVRIEGVRYERKLKRIEGGPALKGVASKLASKYGGGATEKAVASLMKAVVDGNTWIFELAPRGPGL